MDNRFITPTDEHTFHNLPIRVDIGPLNEDRLQQTLSTVKKSLERSTNLWAVGMNLELPHEIIPQADQIQDSLLNRFASLLKARIEQELEEFYKKYGVERPCHMDYLWAREDSNSALPRYRFLLLINQGAYPHLGEVSRFEGGLYDLIASVWASLFNRPQRNSRWWVGFPSGSTYPVVNTTNGSGLRELFYRASFLCKAGAGMVQRSQISFGCSGY